MKIDPIEYDAAFGNLLNEMMISMEKDYMEEQANFECQVIADELKEELVDAQYEDMLDEQAEHMMQMYACHSYDLDAMDYGAHY